jgi:putative two-component system response regulator
MKTHSIRGEEVCKPLRSLAHVLPIVRNHHERWDGGGYPDGLRGAKIPLLARVLQLTDVYDALTTVRPYKPAYTSQASLSKRSTLLRIPQWTPSTLKTSKSRSSTSKITC